MSNSFYSVPVDQFSLAVMSPASAAVCYLLNLSPPSLARKQLKAKLEVMATPLQSGVVAFGIGEAEKSLRVPLERIKDPSGGAVPES